VGLRLVAYASESQVRDDRLCHRSNLFMVFRRRRIRNSMIQELRDSGIEKF
jgi:hypothetical protein